MLYKDGLDKEVNNSFPDGIRKHKKKGMLKSTISKNNNFSNHFVSLIIKKTLEHESQVIKPKALSKNEIL